MPGELRRPKATRGRSGAPARLSRQGQGFPTCEERKADRVQLKVRKLPALESRVTLLLSPGLWGATRSGQRAGKSITLGSRLFCFVLFFRGVLEGFWPF